MVTHEVTAAAIFTGEDGSLGLIKNKTYVVTTWITNDDLIKAYIYDICNYPSYGYAHPVVCYYSSPITLAQNWRFL